MFSVTMPDMWVYAFHSELERHFLLPLAGRAMQTLTSTWRFAFLS